MKKSLTKITSAVLSALLLIMLLPGCGSTPGAAVKKDGRVSVVATIFPAYDFARAVAGDRADITMLLPPGSEIHSYEPTPQDIIRIQNCDVFIYNGGDSDAWVDDVLSSIKNDMDFSDIYYKGGQSFVTSKANADKIKSYTDCNSKDFKVGAQTGSIQQKLATQDTPNADIVPMTKVTDIIQDLLAGNLDGAFIETAVAESYAKNYPDLVVVCEVPYDVSGSAVGVSKGNAALVAAINLAIAAATKDGSMDKFVADANELASGSIYEGTLNDAGAVPSAVVSPAAG